MQFSGGVGYNARGGMYGVAGRVCPVYHGIWSYASLLEYTIREDGSRNRSAVRRRARGEGKMERRMCLLARGDKRTGAIYGSRHNRFHLLRRHRNRIKMQLLPSRFTATLRASLLVSTLPLLSSRRNYLMAAIHPPATPVWPGIERTYNHRFPPFLKLDHVSARRSSSRKFPPLLSA